MKVELLNLSQNKNSMNHSLYFSSKRIDNVGIVLCLRRKLKELESF